MCFCARRHKLEAGRAASKAKKAAERAASKAEKAAAQRQRRHVAAADPGLFCLLFNFLCVSLMLLVHQAGHINYCCRLLCFFRYNFSHCCRTMYHSQAEFLMVSQPLSPVSFPRTLQWWPDGRGYQGWDDRFLRPLSVPQTVPASELFSKYTWSPCTLVNLGLSTLRVNTHVGHIFHHTETATSSH